MNMLTRIRSLIANRCSFLLLCTLGILPFTPAARAAQDHQFEPMDKINLRIVEWQAEAGEFRDWSGVDGIYAVSPSGNLSLPFVGTVNVAGKTAASLAASLEKAFAEKLGIVNQLTASIELAEFPPVLMGGDVASPGSYPYKPGMTVRQALILAGGYPRVEKGSGSLYDRFVNAKAEYDILNRQRNRLRAKQARLEAEKEGKVSLAPPPSIAGQPDAAEITSGEEEILQAQQRRHQLQLRSLNDLKGLLGKEVVSLDKKDAAQQEELSFLDQELQKIDVLKNKGFATNANVLILKQEIADLKSRLLDVDLARMSVEQSISKASQDEIALHNDRAIEISKDLNDTRDELRQADIRISSDRDVMANALLQSSSSLQASLSDEDPAVSFKIFRNEDGKWTGASATQDTALQPGDVVETKLALPRLARSE